MKILLLNQVFYPDNAATAQHSTDLARFLISKGHQVSVVTGARGYEDRSKVYPKRETYQGIEIHRVGSTGLGKKSFLTRVIDSLTFDLALFVKLLQIPKHDVVLSLTSPPLIGFLGMIFVWIKGGKHVQWLMDINPEAAIGVGYLKNDALTTRTLIQIFRLTLRQSFRMIVLDRWMKKTIENHGIPGDRIAVVPPWPVHEVEFPEPLPSDAENPFRKEHGLTQKFVIQYSGNHSIVHPLETLLEAAKRLKNDPDVVFLFIGGGLRSEEVTKVKNEHGLANITQLPYQPREMLKWSLSAANLHVVVMGNAVAGLVHASKIYGVLATGRPYVAIAPKESHLADLIQQNPYGFHVEHGDVEGLLRTIQKAKQLKQEELAAIRRGNLNYTRAHFTAEKILSDFYREVILPCQGTTSLPAQDFDSNWESPRQDSRRR